METWNLYVNPVYHTLPWPFPCNWEEFLRAPQPLTQICDHLARVSPCDGLSETPNVPPHLPRMVPRGKYGFAIYHDEDWLYLFLESEDPEPVISAAELRSGPQLAGANMVSRAVTVFSADEQIQYCFTHDRDDKPVASAGSVLYGPRKTTPPPWVPIYDFHVFLHRETETACWKIARESLADAWIGNTLKLSVSRACFPTVEAVAWGSYHIWGPRPDEAGTVCIGSRSQKKALPELTRLDMKYDPIKEDAEFICHWKHLPDASETFEEKRAKGFRPRPIAWQSCSVRAGGNVSLMPFAETVCTPALPLPEGISRIQVASAAGPAVTVHLEKCSGIRLRLPEWLDPKTVPDDGLKAYPELLRKECNAILAADEDRKKKGDPLEYSAWCTYRASSMGRAWLYVNRDPQLLEFFREQVDFALTLQREDGTFSGFHLRRNFGNPETRWQGGAYDSGPAGELFALAAAILKDEKYRTASEKLLHAYQGYRVEFNHNYCAFALYHLAEHFRLTGDQEALEHGLYYCRNTAAAGITPMGFQAGHNYYTCYGSITLRGLAHFCSVLPEDHPYRPILRERCIRMGNQLLSRLQPNGLFDSCDRYFLGEKQWSFGLFSLARIADPVNQETIDQVTRYMLHCHLRNRAGDQPEIWGRCCENDLILYMARHDPGGSVHSS